ncbi:MAG: threonine aldolase family protein [Pseudomonadota bacterium]
MHDFYSDTKTKPTMAMREAVLEADVGDEQKDEDPTTTELCERVAGLLGKEAAVFLPSGTMCNEIAIRVHIRHGDEVICERSCHIVNFEGGAPAAYSGAMIQALDGHKGTLEPDQVKSAIRQASRYAPRSRLLSVEQTANMSGGCVWPLDRLTAVSAVAKEAGLATHMDGARLMNAVVQSGVSAADYAQGYDSCWIDFSKGLGAPVGAVLAGSADFVERAWAVKQHIGGAMRQSGVLAAMCLYALDHNVERLADDHALAKSIAERLETLPKVETVLPVDTNIVIFDLAENAPSAPDLVRLCAEEGIVMGAFGDRRIRIVTHLDVDGRAGDALCAALSKHLG